MLSLAFTSVPVPLAFFDMLGGSELVVIFLLVLVLFGGEKMPEFARGLGKVIREFRKAASGVEQEFKRALEEEPPRPAPPHSYPATPPNTIMPPAARVAPDAAAAAHAPQDPATPAPPTTSPAAADSHHPDLPDDYHAG